MAKYFIVKSTGVVLKVKESVKVGQGKHAVSLVEQYESRPDLYTPCDAKGQAADAKKKASTDQKAGEGETSKKGQAADTK